MLEGADCGTAWRWIQDGPGGDRDKKVEPMHPDKEQGPTVTGFLSQSRTRERTKSPSAPNSTSSEGTKWKR